MRLRTVAFVSKESLFVATVIYLLCSIKGFDSGETLAGLFVVMSILGFMFYGTINFEDLRAMGKDGDADEYLKAHASLLTLAWDNRKKKPKSFKHGLAVGVSSALVVTALFFIVEWALKLLVYDFFTGDLRIVEAWYYVLDFISGIYLTLGGGVSV